MTQPKSDDEMRKAILRFDLSRAKTGRDFVSGKITQAQADARFDADAQELLDLFNTEKKKWADYVVGGNVECYCSPQLDGECSHCIFGYLLTEQRKRNV
ncbi:hypothetical protein [Rhodococcus sp. NPDC004095]